MILPRLADTAVRAALDRQAAVALIGPRQVGKTTLARGIGDERGALYLDLESREDRDKLASPRLYRRCGGRNRAGSAPRHDRSR